MDNQLGGDTAGVRSRRLIALGAERFSGLAPAEQILLVQAVRGDIANIDGPTLEIGESRRAVPAQHSQWTRGHEIRAEVLRWLLVDRDASTFVAPGGLRLAACKVVGDLDLTGTTVEFPILIGASCFSGEVLLAQGDFRFLSLKGSRIRSLLADGVSCAAGLNLTDCAIQLNARFVSCRLGGSLELQGTQIMGRNDHALRLDSAEVKGSVFLNDGFVAGTGVSLINAEIAGNVTLDGAMLSHHDGYALSADGVHVRGSVYMSKPFESLGEISFATAKIDQNIECHGGTLRSVNGDAFTLSGATIGGSILVSSRASFHGQIYAVGAGISSSVEITGAVLICPDDKTPVLTCDGMHVGINLLVRECRAQGAMRFPNVEVGGNAQFQAISLIGPDRQVVSLHGIQVKNALHWSKIAAEVRYTLNLIDAAVSTFVDDKMSWPPIGELLIDGFRYQRIQSLDERSRPSASRVAERIEWIRRQPSYVAQPFQQYRNTLLATGYEEDAKRVAIAMRDDLRKSGDLSKGSALGQRVLGALVGYGYAPWRAVGLGALFLLAFTVGWCWADHQNLVVSTLSTDSGSQQQDDFSPLWFSIDTFLPIIELDEQSNWEPLRGSGWMSFAVLWLYRIEIVAGWAFSTVFVLAFTGIIRRE